MRLIEIVNDAEVYNSWSKGEKHGLITIPGHHRAAIINPLRFDLKGTWYKGIIEEADVDKLYIISSCDWIEDGLCTPDFKLTTARANLPNLNKELEKIGSIYYFIREIENIEKRLFLVSKGTSGPYTIIEGNKRSVALLFSKMLIGLEVYVYIYPENNYQWSSRSH